MARYLHLNTQSIINSSTSPIRIVPSEFKIRTTLLATERCWFVASQCPIIQLSKWTKSSRSSRLLYSMESIFPDLLITTPCSFYTKTPPRSGASKGPLISTVARASKCWNTMRLRELFRISATLCIVWLYGSGTSFRVTTFLRQWKAMWTCLLGQLMNSLTADAMALWISLNTVVACCPFLSMAVRMRRSHTASLKAELMLINLAPDVELPSLVCFLEHQLKTPPVIPNRKICWICDRSSLHPSLGH